MQFSWLSFWSTCVAFAVAPPFIAIRLRRVVQAHRRSIIDELARFFEPHAPAQDDLIHSFEFVKFKYSSDADFDWRDWLVPTIALVLLLTALNALSGMIVLTDLGAKDPSGDAPLADLLAPHLLWANALLAAYCGAYVFMARAFVQAVNNFDLTPDSLFGAIVNLVLGISLPQIAIFAFSKASGAEGSPVFSGLAFGTAILLSFVGGFMPELILRETFRRTDLRAFKRENLSIFENFRSIPVEVVDGINSQIRDRLKDFHVETIQNLATVNPIMLFVEMPYGIYELIDWVAQAQLCASVGPKRLVRLWDYGVRTIFDLELLLQREGANSELLRQVGDIILPRDAKQGVVTADDVRENILMRISTVHVHRLRQIVIRIGEKLGANNLLLPPLFACGTQCRRAGNGAAHPAAPGLQDRRTDPARA